MAHRLTHDVLPWQSASLVEAETLLAERWGHARFRYHQRRAVLAALRGRDCFALLPTGGGKSICFQVPALLLPGVTVVVSLLISLMQDRREEGTASGKLPSDHAVTRHPADRPGAYIGRVPGRNWARNWTSPLGQALRCATARPTLP